MDIWPANLKIPEHVKPQVTICALKLFLGNEVGLFKFAQFFNAAIAHLLPRHLVQRLLHIIKSLMLCATFLFLFETSVWCPLLG